jgi:hypothetical protein
MDRRRFLLSLAGAGGIAGCSSLTNAPEEPPDAAPTEPTPTAGPERPLGWSGFPSTICSEPLPDDPGIYAITEPAFGADWREQAVHPRYRVGDGPGLAADQSVIGLTGGGAARAYPVSVLWYHEAVNDVVGGTPVVVTYCPLCRSGMVADRTLDGTAATFRVSGLLWSAPQLRGAAAERAGRVFGADRRGGEATLRHTGNVVLVDDATGSYWSQILAQSICGPLERDRLTILPATVATWADWRAAHPDTEVLLPPPQSGTTASDS